eukprot:7193640-Pyramimonas_sp.AAC.1
MFSESLCKFVAVPLRALEGGRREVERVIKTAEDGHVILGASFLRELQSLAGYPHGDAPVHRGLLP